MNIDQSFAGPRDGIQHIAILQGMWATMRFDIGCFHG
jgi:hypothetical protein